MKTVKRPRYLKDSGALCSFCSHAGRCIIEDSIGDKSCSAFQPKWKIADYGIEIYQCTFEEGTRLLEDLTKLVEATNVILQVSVANDIQHISRYMFEVKRALMERIEYLSDLLPKVRGNKTFTVKSYDVAGTWKEVRKENYKAVMRQLESVRSPEELMEELKQIDEELEKCSSQQDSSDSSSGQPSLSELFSECTPDGKLDQSTLKKVWELVVEKKRNASP